MYATYLEYADTVMQGPSKVETDSTGKPKAKVADEETTSTKAVKIVRGLQAKVAASTPAGASSEKSAQANTPKSTTSVHNGTQDKPKAYNPRPPIKQVNVEKAFALYNLNASKCINWVDNQGD